MLVICVEAVTPDLLLEMQDISNEQYNAQNGTPPYEYDIDLFMQLDKNDQLLLVCAWDNAYDEALLGYTYHIIASHPHHKGWKIAYGGIATRNAHRGKGIGRMMHEYTEPLLKARGVARVMYSERVLLDASPLYPKLGFALEERIYKKDL